MTKKETNKVERCVNCNHPVKYDLTIYKWKHFKNHKNCGCKYPNNYKRNMGWQE